MTKKTYHETIDVRPSNFVTVAEEQSQLAAPTPAYPIVTHDVRHVLDVPLSATQHIEMRTSAVDRSLGFLLASVPLYFAFALGVLILSVLFANVPFWSFWGLAIFWSSFVLAWLWGYRETLLKSAEGIAMFEAQQKWKVIQEEQRRRWAQHTSKGDK